MTFMVIVTPPWTHKGGIVFNDGSAAFSTSTLEAPDNDHIDRNM
jgi:hypothetical protein